MALMRTWLVHVETPSGQRTYETTAETAIEAKMDIARFTAGRKGYTVKHAFLPKD